MPKTGKAKHAKPSDASAGEAEAEPSVGLSAPLIESLTAHKSATLAATLMDAPVAGLAAVVYALVLDVFRHRHDTALTVSAKGQSLERVEGLAAFQRLEAAGET